MWVTNLLRCTMQNEKLCDHHLQFHRIMQNHIQLDNIRQRENNGHKIMSLDTGLRFHFWHNHKYDYLCCLEEFIDLLKRCERINAAYVCATRSTITFFTDWPNTFAVTLLCIMLSINSVIFDLISSSLVHYSSIAIWNF